MVHGRQPPPVRSAGLRHWCLLAVILMCPALAYPGETLTVHAAGAGMDQLQKWIDASREGDSIVVPAGTYHGRIRLTKRLTLIGLDRPVLDGGGKGSVVEIVADSCTLRGFTIANSGAMLTEEDAGVLIRSDFNTIEGNSLDNVLFGVYLLGADGNLLADNTITGMESLGLGQRGSGIHVFNSTSNRFIDNRITHVRDGFYIQYGHHSWIEGCEVSNVRYGVHYMWADSNTFLGNSFHDNQAGAAIMYSKSIRMRRNMFRENRGFSSYGILFQDCHGLVADSNIIADNGIGMFLEASTENLFRHNTIARNDVAFQMFQNSTGNVFTENNFIDNLSPLVTVGKRTGSHWSLEGRGNYWSSYRGYDLDADGIGDVPMKIQNVFEFLEGRNPSARLYLYSPAAQALSVASDAFPILDQTTEIDPHPLVRPHGPPEEGEPADSPDAHWALFSAAGLLAGGVTYLHVARKKR